MDDGWLYPRWEYIYSFNAHEYKQNELMYGAIRQIVGGYQAVFFNPHRVERDFFDDLQAAKEWIEQQYKVHYEQ